MTGFRGSDEALDREIATLERIGRTRVRRAAADLAELARELRTLRKERARRHAAADEIAPSAVPETANETVDA
jgi:hypothetical protein